MDFQIREPLHPLLGAMKQTNVMMAVQAAQEYTGQQIHAVNLVTMWAEYLNFDTKHRDGPWEGSTIKAILSNTSRPAFAPGRHGRGGDPAWPCQPDRPRFSPPWSARWAARKYRGRSRCRCPCSPHAAPAPILARATSFGELPRNFENFFDDRAGLHCPAACACRPFGH